MEAEVNLSLQTSYSAALITISLKNELKQLNLYLYTLPAVNILYIWPSTHRWIKKGAVVIKADYNRISTI